jgi:hypothetical protein
MVPDQFKQQGAPFKSGHVDRCVLDKGREVFISPGGDSLPPPQKEGKVGRRQRGRGQDHEKCGFRPERGVRIEAVEDSKEKENGQSGATMCLGWVWRGLARSGKIVKVAHLVDKSGL